MTHIHPEKEYIITATNRNLRLSVKPFHPNVLQPERVMQVNGFTYDLVYVVPASGMTLREFMGRRKNSRRSFFTSNIMKLNPFDILQQLIDACDFMLANNMMPSQSCINPDLVWIDVGSNKLYARIIYTMCVNTRDDKIYWAPELLRKYEEGYQQVLVKISSRKSVPIIRRILSTLFYKIANKLTGGMLPESVSDFRLLDRRTYSAIKTLRESHRFMRGLSSWVGFKTTHIEIERPPRFAGESKFMKISLIGAIAQASRSILAYSATPLLWVSISGFVLSAFSILGILFMSIIWLTSGVPFAGFGTIVGLICLGFSLTMLCIGVLAQYLGLIYEEVKQRPLYIISEQIN